MKLPEERDMTGDALLPLARNVERDGMDVYGVDVFRLQGDRDRPLPERSVRRFCAGRFHQERFQRAHEYGKDGYCRHGCGTHVTDSGGGGPDAITAVVDAAGRVLGFLPAREAQALARQALEQTHSEERNDA